jgi:hypothetical protein
MTVDDMCTGLLKWRQQTTTFPSGKHLGIYKALAKARKYSIYTNNEISTSITYNSNTILPTDAKCLHIQHLLVTLAIKNCHTFDRWKIVNNFLLEKIPGFPLINKLRVIHICNANWSLINNYYVTH